MSAEFLSFGVSTNQLLSQSSSASIVVSESEDSPPLTSISAAQHLEKYADMTTGRDKSVDVASKFDLEIVDIDAPENISEKVESAAMPHPALQKPEIGPPTKERAMVEANDAQRRKFERDKRIDLGVGIATGATAAGLIAGAVILASSTAGSWAVPTLGVMAGLFLLWSACAIYHYLAERGVVRPTEANLT